MSDSSYVKIYKRLLDTTTGRKEMQRFRNGFETASVVGYEFFPSKHGGVFSAQVKWVVSDTAHSFHWETSEMQQRYFYDCFSKFSVKTVVDNHFGCDKDVKTMNCKRDVILGDRKSPKGVEKFSYWFESEFKNTFQTEIENMITRLQAEIKVISMSGEFAEKKEAFTRQCAQEDIRAALALYQFLGDKFLDDSIKEYVAHSILES